MRKLLTMTAALLISGNTLAIENTFYCWPNIIVDSNAPTSCNVLYKERFKMIKRPDYQRTHFATKIQVEGKKAYCYYETRSYPKSSIVCMAENAEVYHRLTGEWGTSSGGASYSCMDMTPGACLMKDAK